MSYDYEDRSLTFPLRARLCRYVLDGLTGLRFFFWGGSTDLLRKWSGSRRECRISVFCSTCLIEEKGSSSKFRLVHRQLTVKGLKPRVFTFHHFSLVLIYLFDVHSFVLGVLTFGMWAS